MTQKVPRELAQMLNAMGWSTEQMYVSPEGKETFYDKRPIFEGLERAGLLLNDDEEYLARQGRPRRGGAKKRQRYRQLTDQTTKHTHYGILPKIEAASGGMELPLGWSGSTEGIMSFMAMEWDEFEMWAQLPRDYLEQVEWIVT